MEVGHERQRHVLAQQQRPCTLEQAKRMAQRMLKELSGFLPQHQADNLNKVVASLEDLQQIAAGQVPAKRDLSLQGLGLSLGSPGQADDEDHGVAGWWGPTGGAAELVLEATTPAQGTPTADATDEKKKKDKRKDKDIATEQPDAKQDARTKQQTAVIQEQTQPQSKEKDKEGKKNQGRGVDAVAQQPEAKHGTGEGNREKIQEGKKKDNEGKRGRGEKEEGEKVDSAAGGTGEKPSKKQKKGKVT